MPYLLEIGFVPFNIRTGVIYKELSKRILIKCPDVETMKKEGKISEWNLKRQSHLDLISEASNHGVSTEVAKKMIILYIEEIKHLTGEKVVLFGKSISTVDMPVLYTTFGHKFINKAFHYQHQCLTTKMAGYKRRGFVNSLSLAREAKRHLGVVIPHTSVEDASIAAELVIEMEKKLKFKNSLFQWVLKQIPGLGA